MNNRGNSGACPPKNEIDGERNAAYIQMQTTMVSNRIVFGKMSSGSRALDDLPLTPLH